MGRPACGTGHRLGRGTGRVLFGVGLREYGSRAPFASRPTDVLTFVASHRGHSRFVTDPLAAQGKTHWRDSKSLTGTYTLHLSRGNYLSLSAGYQRGAAITPRVDTALTTTAFSVAVMPLASLQPWTVGAAGTAAAPQAPVVIAEASTPRAVAKQPVRANTLG